MNINELIDKANEEKVNIVKNENNQIILEIKDFRESSIFAHDTWGMKHRQEYFDMFVSKDDKQYFIFNFNNGIKDSDSLIGITIDENKNVKHAYNKDGHPIREELPKLFVDSVLKGDKKKKFKPF